MEGVRGSNPLSSTKRPDRCGLRGGHGGYRLAGRGPAGPRRQDGRGLPGCAAPGARGRRQTRAYMRTSCFDSWSASGPRKRGRWRGITWTWTPGPSRCGARSAPTGIRRNLSRRTL